jgi:hypothetical protein
MVVRYVIIDSIASVISSEPNDGLESGYQKSLTELAEEFSSKYWLTASLIDSGMYFSPVFRRQLRQTFNKLNPRMPSEMVQNTAVKELLGHTLRLIRVKSNFA